MSVGFGFSTGDFIAALQLVSTVIDALRDSGDSSAEHRALFSQLLTLENALLKVKRIDADEEQHAEVIALRQAACQCQNTIDTFWEKIKKYQPSLRAGGSGSRVRDGWSKIKWALCKKDDVAKFKADLMGHTESIELLLVILHIGSTRVANKKQEESSRALAGRVQDCYFGCMQKMSVILRQISLGVQQGRCLMEMTSNVIQTNVKIFQIVLDLQSIITRIPGQIDRQQPVYLVDAVGRHTPFHLEFITGAESLRSVLQFNFKNIGSGAKKIENGEFAIQDSASKMDVDLSLAWESCFCPGQRYDMSMIFISGEASIQSCPKCYENNGDRFNEDEDIECCKCRIIYRRSQSQLALPTFPMGTVQPSTDCEYGQDLISNYLGPFPQRRRGPCDKDEVALFRRVRIKTTATMTSSRSTANYWPEHQQYENPPCDTLYVGNLPIDAVEGELVDLFSKQRGYRRLCFRVKQNSPMCFVQFEDVSFTKKAVDGLYGHPLHNSIRGGIRLTFSKNPLGVRSGQFIVSSGLENTGENVGHE